MNGFSKAARALLLVFVLLAPFARASETAPGAQFVGSESCAQCHPREYESWKSSHHAAAMAEATRANVLGRFDGTRFVKDGVESRFFERDGKFWVRADGPDGRLADFEIKYTFGVSPLQQYLIELPGGRLQALGFAWDARPAADGGERWFDLYPGKKLIAGDPLHWTGVDQNWNFQCAWCHSTNVKKNYDPQARSFRTTWSQIDVGCEACHGPASSHLDWTKGAHASERDAAHGFSSRFDGRRIARRSAGDSQGATPAPRSASGELRVCAGCHARRQQFSDDAAAVGRFFDAFRPSLLEPGLFHADGQQRDEVFEYASFLQSRMHAAGVTCSDCHDPHSGKLRLEGNAVCGQCHAAERFDRTEHHHHAPGSAAAACATCHMPATTYMGVHARRDHSLRIPRPDRSVTLGVPNACNSCHAEKSATWAREAIASWFSAPKTGAQTFVDAFARDEADAPGARTALAVIAEDAAQSPIARASAIERLARSPSAQVFALARRAARDGDPLIRAAAVTALSGADAMTRLASLAPLLRDETRLVRMDAARALAGDAERGLSNDDRDAFAAALAEYVSAQQFNAERPESHANLGSLHHARGRVDDARAEYEKALELDRAFFPAAIALAEIARGEGDEARAKATLRRSLATNPASGALLHALGLSLIRQKRVEEAVSSLAEAAKAEPNDARFAYVLAVALHDTRKPEEALRLLKATLERHPNNREILMASASYEIEAKDFGSAASHARRLKELEPDDREIGEFSAAVERLAK